MATRLSPFDAPSTLLASLNTDSGRKWKWVEVGSKSKIYELLNGYVPSNLISESDPEYEAARKELTASEAWTQSFKADVVPGKKKAKTGWSSRYDSDSDDEKPSCTASKKTTFNRVTLRSGFGLFCFRDTHSRPLLGLHQRVGDPVGTNCGADHLTSWVLFTTGEVGQLASFMSELVEESERARDGVFPCFGWHIKYQYWQKETSCVARPLSSVVLPTATKDRLVADITHFLSPETATFYLKHGIPYRRSYLFYGLPGTGKTSLVQALAGYFKRSVCVLQPTHPDMTDDSLRAAMIQVPEDSVVVLEDIDSLFDKDRGNKVSKSALTFSGLLNALDGIGSPNGQIFVLTTNLREQLDSALIRNGRVDIQIEFTHATEEQICTMWRSFYPASADLAPSFCTALSTSLGGRPLVTSALQHFFVQQMRSSAEEALANVGTVLEDLKAKDVEEAARKLKEKEEQEGGDKKKKDKKKNDKKEASGKKEAEGEDGSEVPATPARSVGKAKKGAGSTASRVSGATTVGATHIHVHVHTGPASPTPAPVLAVSGTGSLDSDSDSSDSSGSDE